MKDAARRMRCVGNLRLDQDISKSADGLIADIVLHNKEQEGKTGGDFGLIVLRPQIQIRQNSIVIKKGVSSGLLCQAKLKNADGKWGPLQPSQERALSQYKDFYSFVLYSYKNESRNLLNPIHWKVCRDSVKSEIIKSFKTDDFDKLESVSNILMSLGQSKIGTRDDEIIKEIISPGKNQVLEIKIFKPKDRDPKKEVKIRVVNNQLTKTKSKQTVEVYRT